MSAMDVDKSLDEIISSRPKGARRGGRRGGAANGSTRPAPVAAAAGGARARYAGAAPKGRATPVVNAIIAQQAVQPKPATSEALKVIISGLPLDVDEDSVRELMVTTVGQIKVVELAYDSQGKSKGIATVIFRQKGSAQKAFDAYNNRMIDKRRPLKVEVVVDPSKVPLASRVAPLPVQVRAPVVPVVQRGAPGPARRGRGAAGAAPKRAHRPKKTAEDLDKEMLEYAAAGSTAAPAAA